MDAKQSVKQSDRDSSRAGFFYALSAFLIWGTLPLYWKATAEFDPVEVTAHRAIWSLPVAGILLWIMGRTSDIIPTLKSPKRVAILFVCALLISFNWGIFIWAISVERTIETALAYYINPLMSVAMGALFLGERFNRLQLIAIALAAIAVLMLTFLGGSFPWISLSLAITFAFYALLRKTIDVGPVQGFFVEILLIFPFALIFVVYSYASGFSQSVALGVSGIALLIFAGPATAVPLILYASGAKRLRLATIGMMQYIAPSMILLIGLFVFQETVSQWQWIAFILIWAALAVYTVSLFQTPKR